jgi:sugar-specific transcriptional regulator TrmB
MDIVKVFEQLGLKQEHAKIYEASLKWGETSITNIAEDAGIPRTTVYPLIEDLISVGIIKRSLKGGKKNYIPAEPEYLQQLLGKKELEIRNLSSELEKEMDNIKLFMSNKGTKPKLTYLEGSEGIEQAYNMTLELNEGEEIWIQCLTDNYRDIVSDQFFDTYFKKFFSGNFKSKEILTTGDQSFIDKYGSDKNLQLMIDVGEKPTQTDFMVYGDTVIFVSFNQESPYALIIEDKEIAFCVKNMFSLAWLQAASTDPRILNNQNVKTEF